MDAERVTIEVAGHVADVRMVRGDKHNGLDWRMFVALNEALDGLRAANDVRVVVLSGDGPSFCAGLDFKSFAEGNGDLAGDGFAAVEGSIANYAQRIAYGWRELEVPVVAALRGACIGGGLQIALGADVRIAAPDTKLSVMEVHLRPGPRHEPFARRSAAWSATTSPASSPIRRGWSGRTRRSHWAW